MSNTPSLIWNAVSKHNVENGFHYTIYSLVTLNMPKIVEETLSPKAACSSVNVYLAKYYLNNCMIYVYFINFIAAY